MSDSATPGAMATSVFAFFGLRENPFTINPNPRFLYLTPLTQAGSYQLAEGIRNRKGLILLTGEVGTGKTLLLRRLLDWLTEQKMPTALIFNSHVNPDHLLDFILSDFGVPCDSGLKSDKLIALNRWLLERYRLGQTAVLIIDEAQGLPLQALEEVRLLLNLETPREKLLQVVLAGQPELEEKLKMYELRQLRQRVTVRCRTAPLTMQETQAYIADRLRTAGAKEAIFQPDAAASVHAYSHGIPRVINQVCEHALIQACADGSRVVTPQAVERAAHDCQLDQVEAVSRVLESSRAADGTSESQIASIFAGMSLQEDSPLRGFAAAAASAVASAAPSRTRAGTGRDSGAVLSEGAMQHQHVAPLPSFTAHQRAFPERVAQVSAGAPESGPAERSNGAAYRPRPMTERFKQAESPGMRISPTTISLTQAWWRSFSADARSTWRQFERWLRAQVVKMQAYAREMRRRVETARALGQEAAADSRWQALRLRAWEKWEAAATKMLAWRARVSGRVEDSAAPLGETRGARHASGHKHLSSMARLRRWLREPMPTETGRKANRNS